MLPTRTQGLQELLLDSIESMQDSDRTVAALRTRFEDAVRQKQEVSGCSPNRGFADVTSQGSSSLMYARVALHHSEALRLPRKHAQKLPRACFENAVRQKQEVRNCLVPQDVFWQTHARVVH